MISGIVEIWIIIFDCNFLCCCWKFGGMCLGRTIELIILISRLENVSILYYIVIEAVENVCVIFIGLL